MTAIARIDTLLASTPHVHRNLCAAQLIEHAVRNGEGQFSDSGAFCATTGTHTGRSPKDRYIVRDEMTEASVDWGQVNQPMSPLHFDGLLGQACDAPLGDAQQLFVQDLYVGADPATRLKVRVITEQAWHNLFAQNMFIVPTVAEREGFEPDWIVLQRPSVQADFAAIGARSTTCIAMDFSRRMICVVGTEYAGEIKKGMFGVMNYMLPDHGIMPMHCSANVGQDGTSALFFGLSGTGKTTLSADPHRPLIGDDEHGWSTDGVFNFEGGCYAKVVDLTEEREPEIWRASSQFGAVLENVIMDPASRQPDFADTSLTENTRVSYPIAFIDNAVPGSRADQPKNIIFLTADAYGVLPALCKLTPAEAVFHFLSGYTAKVAGTEQGLGNEPQATFSACFGAPFMPRRPMEYAKLLRQKVEAQGVQCWLLNTGWVGGGPGVGQRFPLKATRRLLTCVLDGSLEGVVTRPADVFGFTAVMACPGVDAGLMDPRAAWEDKDLYDATANKLWALFQENFAPFAAQADPDVLALVGQERRAA